MEDERMNALVPLDQLHWNEDTKSFGVLSKSQTDEVIEACVRIGLREPGQISNVLSEYERVMSGQLLFGQFLSGNLGIYEFDEEGSPIFEAVRENSKRDFVFESHASRETCPAGEVMEMGGRFVFCEGSDSFKAFALYGVAVSFCSKWGIDLLSGENPEEHAITRDEPEFVDDMRRRSWRVLEVESEDGLVRVRIRLLGDWFRTDR